MKGGWGLRHTHIDDTCPMSVSAVFQQMMLSRPLPRQLYDGLSTNITFPTLVMWGSGDKVCGWVWACVGVDGWVGGRVWACPSLCGGSVRWSVGASLPV